MSQLVQDKLGLEFYYISVGLSIPEALSCLHHSGIPKSTIHCDVCFRDGTTGKCNIPQKGLLRKDFGARSDIYL